MKQLLKVIEDWARFVELAPGQADDAPPRGLQASVTLAVRLKRTTRSVCRAAVQLDDHSLGAPETVGFYQSPIELQEDVELGDGKFLTGKQGGEAGLEPAADTATGPVAKAPKTGSERRRPSLATVLLEKRVEVVWA